MGRVNMKCPNCGSEDHKVMVDVTMSFDFDKYMNLKKTDLRKADVEIWGVYWPDADIICKNCGNMVKAGKKTLMLGRVEIMEDKQCRIKSTQ